MKVEVRNGFDADTFEADAIMVQETPSGGLTIEPYVVEEDGSLVPQGTTGYARGHWRGYQEVEMPSAEVKSRLLLAETKEDQEAEARSLRLGGKF